MSNPFTHDTTSNAATDHSFADDQGVPDQHLVSFAQAMGAPRDSLGEDDYRFPNQPARADADQSVADSAPPAPVPPWPTPTGYRDGYYPKGWAP
jgi:hypothetical protein